MTDEPIDKPIDVLVVASWFPAYDDMARGRFVADQVEALATTGLARPRVVTFDPARLTGGARARRAQESVVTSVAVRTAGDASTGFQPTAGVLRDVPVTRLTIAEGRSSRVGATHELRHRADVLSAFARGHLHASDGRPGVVHAHVVYPDGAAAVTLAELLGWPLIVTEHSSMVDQIVSEPSVRAAYESTLAAASRVLAVSGVLAAELRDRFPDFAAKVEVMPNAVSANAFAPPPAGERDPEQLLFVGHRKASKGIEMLLRATAIARHDRPSIKLRLVGRAPDAATEARWHELTAELGMSGAVVFEEAANRGEVAAAMHKAAVFVHPSPRETFGVVAAEALASGLPVVAADSGGVTEILGPDPARFGALVSAGEPEALAGAIVATLGRLGDFDAGDMRRWVERRYGNRFVAERLAVIYREAIASAPTAPQVAIDAPASGPPTRPTIVVALDRRRAALRLSALADDLRASIVLVTASEPRAVVLPPVADVVELPVDTRWGPDPMSPPSTRRPGIAGGLGRLAHDPRGTTLRLLGRDAASEHALAGAGRAVAELARKVAGDGPVEIVAIDGHDHLAAADAIRSGSARPAAGGLSRLADAWDAARSSVGSSS